MIKLEVDENKFGFSKIGRCHIVGMAYYRANRISEEALSRQAVLVNRQDDATAYGPADIIQVYHQTQPAAHLVHRYGKQLKGDEREAAANYLRQWPDGPQL